MFEKPVVLKDVNVYVEDEDFLGKGEIELPKITQVVVEHTAMGISGKVEVPLPGIVEKMEGKLKFSSFDPEALKRLYDASEAQRLDVRGSVERYNPATGRMEEVPVRIVMRAFMKEGAHPTFKQAQNEGPEFTFSAVYWKEEWDGETVLEVDPFAYIYRVNGRDLLVQTRANLGLS
ncbi:MAG: phage major tail tube protein [Thermodesulfatator sp.]|nr:MAG: phage major tail tube protein [Thermodesulfatator sp.]